MAFPYSSADLYTGVAVQSALGTAAAAPSMYLPVNQDQTSLLEWMLGRQPVDRSTGDYYTEQGAPINEPHGEGTLVMPAQLSQLNDFYAMAGMAGGADPGTALVPPTPLTFFQGLGYKEEIWQDVFVSGQPTMSVSTTQNGLWTIPLLGMTEPVDHAVRVPTFPAFEEEWRLSDLFPATLIVDSAVVQFSSFRLSLIIDIAAQYYSRGDGKPSPSALTLQKLGGFVDFRVALKSAAERDAFLNACGQPGALVFPFSRTCGLVTNTFQVGLPNGLHVTRKPDAPKRAMIGESYTTRGLRAADTPFSPVMIAYT